MFCYRHIAGEDHHSVVSSATQHVSDTAVLRKLGAPAPELLLVLARFFFFIYSDCSEGPILLYYNASSLGAI